MEDLSTALDHKIDFAWCVRSVSLEECLLNSRAFHAVRKRSLGLVGVFALMAV